MDQVMHRGALALLRSVAIGATCSLPLLGLALAGPKEERKVDPASQRKELARILTNEALWGKDLPDALAHLGAWGELKETKVIVFPKSIVGATPQKEAGAAEHLKTLTESIKAAPAGFRGLVTPSSPVCRHRLSKGNMESNYGHL